MSSTGQHSGRSLVSESTGATAPPSNGGRTEDGTAPQDASEEYVDGVAASTPTRSPVAATRIPITHRELPVE
jgi:hypothetical protein